MSVGEPGVEATRSVGTETDAIQPGQLIESMQTGLNRLIGIEETFSVIKQKQEYHLSGSVDLDEAMSTIEEVQWALAEGVPSRVFEFLERRTGSTRYDYVDYAKAGYAAFLLGVKDRLIEREQQVWAEGPVAREWLGEPVLLRRPPASVTRKDENWGSQGPLYRDLDGGEPASPYYRNGDIGNFHGKLRHVSLEQDGRVILGRRGREATEIIEMFEAIKDPKTGVITSYVPRLSIERVSRADRLRRTVRDAAVDRLGPELPED